MELTARSVPGPAGTLGSLRSLGASLVCTKWPGNDASGPKGTMMGCCTFFGSSNNKPRSSSYSSRLKLIAWYKKEPKMEMGFVQKWATSQQCRISLDANDVRKILWNWGYPKRYPNFQTNPDVILLHHVEVAYPTTSPLRLIVFIPPFMWVITGLNPPFMFLILKSLLPEGLSSRAFALLSACFSCSSKFRKLTPTTRGTGQAKKCESIWICVCWCVCVCFFPTPTTIPAVGRRALSWELISWPPH